MKHELQDLFRRPIDLVEREALVNPYRKKEILNHHRTNIEWRSIVGLRNILARLLWITVNSAETGVTTARSA